MSKEKNGVKYSQVLRVQVLSVIALTAGVLSSAIENTDDAVDGQAFATTLLTVIGIMMTAKGIRLSNKYNK